MSEKNQSDGFQSINQINQSLSESLSVANEIAGCLTHQGEAINHSIQLSDDIQHHTQEAYQTIRSMESTPYRLWLWIVKKVRRLGELVPVLNSETRTGETSNHIINLEQPSSNTSNVEQVNLDNASETLHQLDRLKDVSLTIGQSLSEQISHIDQLQESQLKNEGKMHTLVKKAGRF